MGQYFICGPVFGVLRCLDAEFAHPVHDGDMADTEYALDLPVAHALDVKLQGFGYIIAVDLLSKFRYGEVIVTLFTPISLPVVNNTALNVVLGATFGTFRVLHYLSR